LATHHPVHVSAEADAQIRKEFTVLFDRSTQTN